MGSLLGAVLAFAFLSSEAARLLGLEGLRTAAFLVALAALLTAAAVRSPRFPAREPTVPILLALLLAAIVVTDGLAGEVDPSDYRIAILLLVFFAAPLLTSAMAALEVALLVWRLLAGYVLATAIVGLVAMPEVFVRGRADLVRFDFSGSLVSHTGLCLIFLFATFGRMRERADAPARILLGGAALLALLMVLLTGTRTALVTFGCYLLLDLASDPERHRAFRRLGLASLGGTAALALYTIFVSDDFVERLMVGSSDDWSSGRLDSQLRWLELALEQPLGLGFGAVRELLRDGRPAIDGTRLLEWPHNEPVRFFVEAGVLGLGFLLLLLGWSTGRALHAARREPSPLRRALLLAIVADMLGQSLFQNYFNNIYYATALLLVLVVLVEQAGTRPADPLSDVASAPDRSLLRRGAAP